MIHEQVTSDRLSPDQQREFLRRMLLIRRVEERIVQLGNRGDFPGHYHVYIGQEATGVPITAALIDGDTIVTTHRNHGHAMARGAEPRRVIAEILGKDAGYCHGKAGSIHIAVPSLGIISASGIVAGSIPTATGAAVAYRYGGSFPELPVAIPAHRPPPAGGPPLAGRVAVAFFGDGALNEGAWHESAVLATWWKLPIVYVCENNNAVPYSAEKAMMCGPSLVEYAAGYGMATEAVDGTDIGAVWAAFQNAAAHARSGEGPVFLECRTAAWPGNATTYPSLPLGLTDLSHAWQPPDDPKHEIWFAHDPVLKTARRLVDTGVLSRDGLNALDAEAQRTADEADHWAHAQPEPPPVRAHQHIFAE